MLVVVGGAVALALALGLGVLVWLVFFHDREPEQDLEDLD